MNLTVSIFQLKQKFRLKAPAKQSQNFNATYRNIVGCNMLRAFGHPVVTCCDMLGVVGSNLKMVKFFMQHLWMLLPFRQVHATMLRLGMRISWIFNSQHVATRWVVKRVEHVAPNNVAICCVQMWRTLSGIHAFALYGKFA